MLVLPKMDLAAASCLSITIKTVLEALRKYPRSCSLSEDTTSTEEAGKGAHFNSIKTPNYIASFQNCSMQCSNQR